MSSHSFDKLEISINMTFHIYVFKKCFIKKSLFSMMLNYRVQNVDSTIKKEGTKFVIFFIKQEVV